MKRFTSKSFLIVFVLAIFALPLTVQADSGNGGDELTQTVNGYQITVVFEEPASLGENPIHVSIMDAQYMPVSQADLEVGIVDNQSEPIEFKPTVEIRMTDTDSKPVITPTSQNSMAGMEGTTETPTAESSMAGMDSTTEKANTESGMAEKSVQEPAEEHDQMTKLIAGHENGEYDGDISIINAGDSTLRIHLTVKGELMEADFPLHIAQSHTGSFVLGGFFIINAALIAAAVILKPKPVL